MTKRIPVSAKQNIWFDSQQVDNIDLSLEQDSNTTIQSSIINNHIGTGVLPEVLVQNILFDSSLTSGFLDGLAVLTQNQPADNNFGNQLEIELSGSFASGKRMVKVCVIGLDFNSSLQYETFYFKNDEIQITNKHFTNILVLLFNDLLGDPDFSFNLGGTLTIKEAKPMTLSRDPVMVAQDIQPNLFFRDFFLDSALSLDSLLQAALPLYNIDDLKIYTAEKDNKAILSGDVTTQIGQKFIAETNNIQKVTLLLSVRNQEAGNESDLAWTGDLVVSIYPLQSSIECATDIAPNFPIEFAPSNIALAQISINYVTLQAAGIILDSVPQPVDFVLSNTPIAAGSIINVGSYYAVAAKRSGSADKCDILFAVGDNLIDDSRITTFTGTLWVDIPEEDLWFKVWTDAAKISDGQAYENGHGIIIEKTEQDVNTLNTTDHSLNKLQFTGTNVFKAVVTATTLESDSVPDQRTGNPVLSRKQFVPEIKLLNTIDMANLEAASDPLVVGAIADKNKKFFDALNSIINSKLYSATIVANEIIIKIVDDPTDSVRYNTSVSNLASNLLNGDFIGAKIIPNILDTSLYYKIASASLCSMIYGDVNGDGIIDEDDLSLLNSYLNYNLNVGLLENSTITTNSVTTTFSNGYSAYSSPFSDLFGISFQVVNPTTNAVIGAGTDGILVADPNDNRLARFTSGTVNFTAISNLADMKLVILNSTVLENYGGFDITSIDSFDILTIRKVFLNGEAINQMFRADIDGDFYVTSNDGYLLESYINRLSLASSPTPPHPAPTSNAFAKIGSKFNVITFKLEKFIDRADDYSSVTSGRPDVVHALPDVYYDGYVADGYFINNNFYTNPISFSIEKRLTWDEFLITTNSRAKLVPSIFSSLSGFVQNSCSLDGTTCTTYPISPDFNSGINDFFIPDNLIIGEGGDIKRPDGANFKMDFEVGTITLEIPTNAFETEHTLNIFDSFVANYNGSGLTRRGFYAMKFADCSYVETTALSLNQIRFSVAVQSFSPNIDGYSFDGYSGVVVDGRIGVSINYTTGDLILNFTNLFQDPVLLTVSTKIQISVFMKKAGFNNIPLFIDSDKVKNLLGID
jgi:hypothetical protein